MGLGSFRWRLLLIIIIVLLFWHTPKIWSVLTQPDSVVKAQVSVNQAVTLKDEDKEKTQQVRVAVYYETLCPDSRNFFIKQLLPTYNKIEDNMHLEFVPYGKAETTHSDQGYEFTCQHGPVECQGNIIHACSIDIISNPSVLLNYLSCMIKNNVQPVNIMETCAQKFEVDGSAILECYQGQRGKELLAKYGEMTRSLEPKVSFIPTVTLDGSSEGLPRMLKNLLHEICLRLRTIPEGCKT